MRKNGIASAMISSLLMELNNMEIKHYTEAGEGIVGATEGQEYINGDQRKCHDDQELTLAQ